ncbi:hypothetical protein CEY00_Acc15760 [Actinidia chinensis var. chinensis]|uniref:DUF7054 domain-containing protein n=1 Tax=Actinidia chinensis var. chinensis TaxID=1590841 RepID=A0A2R6QNJ2_ACTCC|nr:hypothetical protein CEY00_Acc15760 [Actinidia chinensis var. chinensis]
MTSLLPIDSGQIPPAASGLPPRHKLVRRRGGLIVVPRKLRLPTEVKGARRPPKLLLNVNIQGSVGTVQVVISPENAVGDLIKAAVETYVKEMRRPLLKETDPRRFELHYSQFSLESLKTREKLINLGSRNFYLCRKPTTVADSSCSNEAMIAAACAFPLTNFMDFLL